MQVIEVVVNTGTNRLDRRFHYGYDGAQGEVLPGMRVEVPFAGRILTGYVLAVDVVPEVPLNKLKHVRKVLDQAPLFSTELLELGQWLSNYYLATEISALEAMLPGEVRADLGPKRTRLLTVIKPGEELEHYLNQGRNRAKQRLVIEYLSRTGQASLAEVLKATGLSDAPVQTLIKHGFVGYIEKIIERQPQVEQDQSFVRPLPLTSEQELVFAKLKQALQTGGAKQPCLLYGVTGSGKTELYLQIIALALQRGQGAIVLVPEISLTPQTVQRFQSRFGQEVAVLHSRLSAGERRDEWRRIHSGERRVVVGARSAVFAPVHNLGLIIIDEEHENSYKQDETPRYHARDVARKRMELVQGLLVLGSATPSIESYHKALQGEYTLLELPNRVLARSLPSVEVIDMRLELEQGNKSIFSQSLVQNIEETLAAGQQVMLFLNRRGFSTFVVCRQCGHVLKCHSCDISLTYHVENNKLLCHYCNQEAKVPGFCPKCNSRYIKYFGAGTQKVEEAFKQAFPGVTVERMDVDTTRTKGAHERILTKFRQGQTQVLIGTQMIAKGHDFPNVTLVGVISSDTALHIPDFRAGERTFQLLTQVAGRAGRGDKAGKVIVQTYNPEHYSIIAAQQQDFVAFYQEEIEVRELTDNPPFSQIIRLVISGSKEAEVVKAAEQLEAQIRTVFGGLALELWGPAPAPISKIKQRYRWHLALKAKDWGNTKTSLKQLVEEFVQGVPSSDLRVIIDVDPQAML